MLVAPDGQADWTEQALDELARALTDAHTPALVAKLTHNRVGVLLAVHPDHGLPSAISRAAAVIHGQLPNVPRSASGRLSRT